VAERDISPACSIANHKLPFMIDVIRIGILRLRGRETTSGPRLAFHARRHMLHVSILRKRMRRTEHRGFPSRRCKLGILALICALCGACHRRHSSGEQPDPSASAVALPIAIALGACSDFAACERECDAGSADRCRRLAASYAFGQGGVSKDEARAALLYQHACEMKDPSSCVFAGQMNEYARGVAKDDAKAFGFYKQACDLQWAPGCYNLAIMFERGTGVPVDEDKAADLYQAACDAGAVTSCEKAQALKVLPLVRFLDGGQP
jgi:hypothetical protein